MVWSETTALCSGDVSLDRAVHGRGRKPAQDVGSFPGAVSLASVGTSGKQQLSETPGRPSVHTSSLSTSSLTASRTSDTFICKRLPYPHYYRVSTKGFPRNIESNDVRGGWLGRESSRLAETPSVTQPPGCPGRAWPGQDEERGAAGAGAPRRGQERVWPTGGPAELIQDQGGGRSPLGSPEPPGRNRVKKPPYIQVQTHRPWDPGEQTSDLGARDSEQGGTRSHLLQKPHFTAAQQSPQVKVGATELPWAPMLGPCHSTPPRGLWLLHCLTLSRAGHGDSPAAGGEESSSPQPRPSPHWGLVILR